MLLCLIGLVILGGDL